MKLNADSSIHYIGVDDLEIDLFESQYVVPEGMSYNSYLIQDEKIAVLDTVDERKEGEWEEKLSEALSGREPSYLVVHHVEPDHSGSVIRFLERYKSCRVVCSAKAAELLSQFYDYDFSTRTQTIKEGDTLSLGSKSLQFFSAPMVHWPEVMVSYCPEEKVLFAADAFGKFGALSRETPDWACEARRYYFNICGKYGAAVQTLLGKVSVLDVRTICPLHGPVLSDNLGYYLGLYDTWSSYRAEVSGVFVAYCSMHGGTEKAAIRLAELLRAKGVKVSTADLSRSDMAECVEDAFKYDTLVLAAPTYDGSVMPVMRDFLTLLKAKAYQARKVALIENGSWAPVAAREMRLLLSGCKDLEFVEPVLTLRSALKPSSEEKLMCLASAIMGD